MNLFDHFQNGLEKVASRRARRDQRFADALKDPKKSGLAHVSAILNEDRHLTPAQVRQMYQNELGSVKPYFAALTAEGMGNAYKDKALTSQTARKHHHKAQKRADRKAGSIFNRILPGGAGRKAKHQARSEYHTAQADKHALNAIDASGLSHDHHLDSQRMGEGGTVPGGSKRARQLADAYMKKHFG